MTWTYSYPAFVSATGPLCKCGSHNLSQDRRYRWRCGRGHFARYVIGRRSS